MIGLGSLEWNVISSAHGCFKYQIHNLNTWNFSVPVTVQPFQRVQGGSRNSGCELGRFVALSGVTEAGLAPGGQMWLGEEGAVIGVHRHPLMVPRREKGSL